jgi:hypothetical protein
MSDGNVAHAMELWILIRTLHSVEDTAALHLHTRAREEVQATGHAMQVSNLGGGVVRLGRGGGGKGIGSP